jgi:hypothetical protein
MMNTSMHWVSTEHLKQLKEKMMLHESIKDTYTETVIKDHEGFRLVLKTHEVLMPKGLYSVDFEQQSLDLNGEVRDVAVYNFFMTREEMATLASALTA